jgi:hypothetical protein
MLPLKDDWLIRPLFYITSPEEKLQHLAQSIFKYSEQIVIKNIFPDVFKLTLSNHVLLATHFLIGGDVSDSKVVLNHTSKDYISALLDEVVDTLDTLKFSDCSKWLLKTYPAIFDAQRFFDTL